MPPRFPCAKTVRQRLQSSVTDKQKSLLQKLPPGAKMSLALDCWTSPFRQAFMAVTGYFIDQDWEYREILLRFEPLYGDAHTGAHLSSVLLSLLHQYEITDRVLAITTDNASNNNTMMSSTQEAIQSIGLDNTLMVRLPCLAHVIQLSLNDLLKEMKANPGNEVIETVWSDSRLLSSRARQNKREIIDTLNKV